VPGRLRTRAADGDRGGPTASDEAAAALTLSDDELTEGLAIIDESIRSFWAESSHQPQRKEGEKTLLVRTLDTKSPTRSRHQDRKLAQQADHLAKDGLGFSVHEPRCTRHGEATFWYANHIEAVFITPGGRGREQATGEVSRWPRHDLRAQRRRQAPVRPKTEIKCVCVFTRPVTGREVHDENGVYPLITSKERTLQEESSLTLMDTRVEDGYRPHPGRTRAAGTTRPHGVGSVTDGPMTPPPWPATTRALLRGRGLALRGRGGGYWQYLAA